MRAFRTSISSLAAMASGVVLCGLPVAAVAQTWGQPYSPGPVVTYGQPHAGAGQVYGGQGYGSHRYGGWSDPRYGDPHAYRPPARYHGHHRGRRDGEWTRWSSPPGRGYHDVYGYNDDRAPRGPDRQDDRRRHVEPYLYDH